jgi:hypothetical protein
VAGSMAIQILGTDYVGQKGPLFWLALKSSILTVLTLGFYRFWMKTRLRRYYWSAIRPGGVPLEYTGTGTEKLMGFLITVVFLAFYIGVFNLLLMFVSYSLLSDNFAAYFSSFLGLIPIYFYAQYRARRYILARTRWRGVRFGTDTVAWGYAWRAMLHWGLTLLTLGLLLPRQVFLLEKFRTDHTWFGQERFYQSGKWTMLLKPAVHFYIGLVLCVLGGLGGYFIEPAAFGLLSIGYPWLLVGWVHFRVAGFRVMTKHKVLGAEVLFRAQPKTWTVIKTYILGGLLVSFIMWLVLFGVLFVIIGGLTLIDPALMKNGGAGQMFEPGGGGMPASFIALIAFSYFTVFIFWGVLGQVFITLPIMRHYAETLAIGNSHHLVGITQRPRDEFAEAEGFAEALDIGAAI